MKGYLAGIVMVGLALVTTGCASTQSKDGAVLGGFLGAGVGAVMGHQTGHGGEGALIGGVIGAASGAIIGEERAQEQARRRPVVVVPPPVVVQRTAPPIRVQRVKSISSRSSNGHYEWQVVTASSGEKYERRVWVLDR